MSSTIALPSVIRLHPQDGVVIARIPLTPGTEVAPGISSWRKAHPARA